MPRSTVPDDGFPQAPVPDALSRALVALEESGVSVAVLRSFEADGQFVEVDLLVASRCRRKLSHALVPCGFAPLRAWGHRGHRFYLGYSAGDGLWLKLDFVARVAGADAELALASRRRVDSLPRLEPDVESALLLLHCIVDKGGRLGRHASALGRLGAVPPPPPGAPDGLHRLWPELWRGVAAPSAALPDALVRRAADLVAPHRARRARWNRCLRRAAHLRRALRPTAPTVAMTAAAHDGRDRVCERLMRELGPGARRVSVNGGRGRLARVRRRLTVELARRRADGPVVIDAGPDAAGLASADVVVTGSPGERVSEAVWRAYGRRLLG